MLTVVIKVQEENELRLNEVNDALFNVTDVNFVKNEKELVPTDVNDDGSEIDENIVPDNIPAGMDVKFVKLRATLLTELVPLEFKLP